VGEEKAVGQELPVKASSAGAEKGLIAKTICTEAREVLFSKTSSEDWDADCWHWHQRWTKEGEEFPLSLFQNADICRHLIGLGFDGVCKHMKPVRVGDKDDAREDKDDVNFEQYSISTRGLVFAMAAMTVAAALRSDRTKSLVWDGNTGYVTSDDIGGVVKSSPGMPKAIPLIMPGSGGIPHPLRTTARPVPNSDFDVQRTLFRGTMVHHADEMECQLKKIDGSVSSFHVPEETSPKFLEFVADSILTAFVGRCTGRVSVHELFPDWVDKKREAGSRTAKHYSKKSRKRIPTPDMFDLYREFRRAPVDKSVTLNWDSPYTFVSGQHPDTIPFKAKNKEELDGFLANFGVSGRQLILDYLESVPKAWGSVKRTQIRKILINAVVNSASGLKTGEKLDFVVHQSLADVESLFPGIFGNVEFESIAFGYGSRTGLQLSTRQLKGKKFKDKFTTLHAEIKQMMLEMWEKGGDEKRVVQMLGWELIHAERDFVSVISRRKFSFTDTEHICCKIYLCVATSYSSRSISELPRLWNNGGHCWPVLQPTDWAEGVENAFKEKILPHFKGLKNKLILMQEYPVQLNYYLGQN